MSSSMANHQNVADRCLLIEAAGQSWYVPLDTIAAVPRIGESIRIAGIEAGTVGEVEYEFAPEPAPIRMAEEMPDGLSYARPTRIRVKIL